ncbi:hypothetical protein LO772_00160 [Yinghuangia sp. ASG 101]|uniref:hypothetical protein n=1 Tax=Yinghuangia sp. ASG 101 TaxID=2896848 RepID=UPI001E31FF01|nr:hypothetical protein [Yinghuangia sp. ASG 101]UGQ12067.1 hypothetical protein LO772_00160 [Yinghuangia sp. ASG 101]
MADTTIRVPADVRDHLAELAAERGTTIGQLVAALARPARTRAQIRASYEHDRDYIAAHLVPGLGDDDADRGLAVLADIKRRARG